MVEFLAGPTTGGGARNREVCVFVDISPPMVGRWRPTVNGVILAGNECVAVDFDGLDDWKGGRDGNEAVSL